ncbi:MAG: mechanosensitive ion channel [Nanoarchaeota archaeon]|nr:mechanosensitive ion channel [Nanoarchaeota archaeon]
MVDYTIVSDLLSGQLAVLVAAIAILLVGVVLARFFSRFFSRILQEIHLNKILKNELGIKLPLEEFVSRFVLYIIYFVAIVMALNQLGLTTTILYIILLAILIIIIVLIILAFKDFMPNLTAGIYLYQKKIIKEGDIVDFMTVKGKVSKVELIETRIKTKEGDEIFIPNSLLLKSEVRKLRKD